MAEALRADPAFGAELARLELGLTRPGGDRLAVPAAPPPVDLSPPPVSPPPRWPVLDGLAASRRLRLAAVLTAGGLAAVAFTLLQPAGAGPVRRLLWLPRRAARVLRGRYRAAGGE